CCDGFVAGSADHASRVKAAPCSSSARPGTSRTAADRQRGRGLFVGEGAHRLAVVDAREAPAERGDALAPILRTDAAMICTRVITIRTADPALDQPALALVVDAVANAHRANALGTALSTVPG